MTAKVVELTEAVEGAWVAAAEAVPAAIVLSVMRS